MTKFLCALLLLACVAWSATVKRQQDEQLITQDAGLTYSDVIENCNNVDFSEPKKFPNAVLAYVTPWNKHGFEVTKKLAQKFTHISPVWFQITPSSDAQSPTCTVTGAENLDQAWVDSVREKASGIKIVPNFLFEKWSMEEYQQIFADANGREKCAQVVLEFLEKNGFDGAVFEVWEQVMSMSQDAAAKVLIDSVINWGKLFNAKSKEFIIAVPPPLDAGDEMTGVFTKEHFDAVAPHISYINLETYDFPATKGPISPINWARRCIEYLTGNDPKVAQVLLMGINFYGHEQTNEKSTFEIITGKSYIDLLKTKKPELQWDSEAAEHFFKIGDHLVYYPSLASIGARLKLAKELNVGVGIWEAGEGLDHFFNQF